MPYGNLPVSAAVIREGKQALAVDDEGPWAGVMARALREDGYQVSVVYDGYEDGLKMATLRPDVRVLDFIMPGLDGFSIGRRVLARSRGAGHKASHNDWLRLGGSSCQRPGTPRFFV